MSSFVKQGDVRQEQFDWNVIDWRLVHIDSLWSTEHAAAEAAFQAARELIDAGLAA